MLRLTCWRENFFEGFLGTKAFIKLWKKLKSLNGISDDLNWLRSSDFKEDGEIITKLCAQLLERMAILKQEAYKQGYNIP